jgi:mannose-6-phosphate isomerase class I
VIRESVNGHDVLVASTCFVVERYVAKQEIQFDGSSDSAQVIVAVDGSGIIESPGAQPVSFNRGEAVVIPAALREYRVRPQWTIEFMRMRLPAEKLPPPKTTMS